MDKTPALAQRLALVITRGNSVSPVNRLSTARIVNMRCCSERSEAAPGRGDRQVFRHSDFKRSFHFSASLHARRALDFENTSPEARAGKCDIPSISISGIECDLSPARVKRRREESVVLPSVDTPDSDRRAILQGGQSKAWLVLGRGCFGTVVKAKYRNENVAVKIIPKNSRLRNESLEREMNALDLHHPNIIRVLSIVDLPNAMCGLVIMELWHSMQLQQLIETPLLQFNFKQKLRCSLELCHGLQYCHRRSIVHLDVKPKNVLVHTATRSCKICDFGSSVRSHQQRLRHQGTMVYMAPELLTGGWATDKADVYALGITMWQLLHGEPTPYGGEDLDAVVYRVVSEDYRPTPLNVCPAEGEFVELYKRCWHHDQTHRPDIEAVIEQLVAITKECDCG